MFSSAPLTTRQFVSIGVGDPPPEVSLCRYERCRKLLPPRNGKGGPKKEFCTNSCRTQYYIAKKVEKQAAEMIRSNPSDAVRLALEAATEEATRPLLSLIEQLQTKCNLAIAQMRSLRNAQ